MQLGFLNNSLQLWIQLFLAAIGIRSRISLLQQAQISRFPDSDANRPFIGIKNLAGMINNHQEHKGTHNDANPLEDPRKMDRNMPGCGNAVSRGPIFGPSDSFTDRISVLDSVGK